MVKKRFSGSKELPFTIKTAFDETGHFLSRLAMIPNRRNPPLVFVYIRRYLLELV